MAEATDRQDPWREFLRSLAPEQRDKFVGAFLGMAESALEKSLPPLLENAFEKLGYSREIAGLVQLLAAKSDDTKEDVLRKALTLYGLALDAREKGNRMAILTPDDVIVHEVVGFEPVDQADLQTAS